MTMHIHPGDAIGDIVAADYRAAAVFERFGLDFCCAGRRTLDDVCRERSVDALALLSALDGLARTADAPEPEQAPWPLDELIDHIVSRHHGYVRGAIPTIAAHTAKVAAVHGARRPELVQVARVFTEVAEGMRSHMAKEEEILFPYIRLLVEAERSGRRIRPSPFGTIHNPIRMMETEHEHAGDEMRLIRELTDGYAPPELACSTYRVSFAELEEFERDLHRHVHLENNVLFPAAIRLEERLT
jgi:regulator of cell morphogenesis and NO signaling